MRKTFLALVISLLGALMACGIKSNPAEKPITSEKELVESQVTIEESWQVEWEKTLQAAKKEGSVSILSTRGGDFREAVMTAFQKKYGIVPEMISGSSQQFVAKVSAERMAGLYLADIQLTSTINGTVMVGKGFLDKLDPMLILPEVKDPKYWKDFPPFWFDKEHYMIMPGTRPGLGVMYNTNLVKRGELKSYFDLLQPKWKGKILMDDPVTSNSGNGTFAKIKVIIDKAGKDGEYFWRQIAKQEPQIQANSRLLLEWLIQGKYAISFGKDTESFIYAVEGGAPVDAFVPEEGTWMASSDQLVLMNKAPHPNAAKVFINWYLSKEAADLTQPLLGAVSSRVDFNTELINPWLRFKPGAKYEIGFLNPEWENVIRPSLLPLAQEIFSPLLR